MQFLYPGFLWALTALAIPVILHLFYFRRYKTVFFSNLRFLREVKEETSARNRLRNLLILLARLLALALLILAFAQPVIPLRDEVRTGTRHVSLFVDNSFSMQSFGRELSLFDKGRQRARDIVTGYGTEDKFQLLGHDLSAAQNQWISRDDALQRLEEWDFTPSVVPLSVIRNRQMQSFAGREGVNEAWMISDFQQSIMDLTPADTAMALNLLPLRGVQEKNVAIDTAWFESPVVTLNQSASLLFTLRNYAPEEVDNIRVSVAIDGQERPEGTIDLPGDGSLTDTVNLTVMNTGWHQVALRISDFPVTFDDTYYLTYYVEENLNVLVLNDRQENPRIRAVFSENAYFRLEQNLISQLEYSQLNRYQLIILHQPETLSSGLAGALRQYAENGGKVLFIPARTGNVDQYNAFLQSFNARPLSPWREGRRAVGAINTDAFVFRDVFRTTRPNMRLPIVNGSFPTAGSGTSGEALLTFRDGGTMASFHTPGSGAVALLSAPLDEAYNDLTLQPEIFVPLLYRLAVYSAASRPLAYTIGRDQLIAIDAAGYTPGTPLQVTGPATFLPGITQQGNRVLLDMGSDIQEAGFFRVAAEESLLAVLAYNYDRKESDLAVVPDGELSVNPAMRVWIESDETDFTELIREASQGKPLWRWCIALALFFLACEIALIRLWKGSA